MSFYIDRTFAGGEISPALAARHDVGKQRTGCKTLRNFYVQRFGGVQNRAGFRYCGHVGGIDELVDTPAMASWTGSVRTALIPWVYSNSLTYVLELGAKMLSHTTVADDYVGYVRFWTNGARLGVGETYAAYNAGTSYSKGQAVSYSGNNYSSKTDSNTGNTPPTADFYGDTNWHLMPDDGTYEIYSPYNYNILSQGNPNDAIRYAQSASVMTLVHPTYAPKQLTRTDTYQWSFSDISFTGSVFGSSDNYPSTVTYSQQRQVFANTNDEPENVWMSEVSVFNDFTLATGDSEPVIFTINGRQVNSVQHVVEVAGKLVILTTGSEWTVEGDSSGIVTPTAINLRQQGYRGASAIPPIYIGNTILYVQARGSVVRDFNYDFATDGYKGNDLSLFANHFFDDYTLVDWAYAQIPHSVVWAVRSDGALLSLTYVPDQDVWGWALHDTGARDSSGTTTRSDSFESVAVIPEGNEDRLYAVVKRTINGNTVRYVERMELRNFTDIKTDAIFVDSFLTHDGRNTGSETMTLSTGATWTVQDTITVTRSSGGFTSGSVGDAVVVYDDDNEVTIQITGYTSSTVVTGIPNKDIPASLQSVATTSWKLAVDTVTGLDHLEGETVSVMADGNVGTQAVVSSGSISLSVPGAVVHVGLPITADFQSLDIDTPDEQTLLVNRKTVDRVGLVLEESRGVFVGPSADDLTELKQRDTENWNEPIAPFTGTAELKITSKWRKEGTVYVRQIDPLPLTILALIPQGKMEE